MEAAVNLANSSTSEISFENDYFHELYSDSGLKQITLAFYFTGSIFGLFSEFGIIWYEKHGNHRYRTLINQLFATISWFVICYILFVFIPEGIRYMMGPLDAGFCDVHNILKNFFSSCILITMDCIIFLRYIFIFRWSNFMVINDDFIVRFVQLSILLLGFWIAAVKRISVGKMPLNYFLCTGINPNSQAVIQKYGIVSRKFGTVRIIAVLSFVLHVFVFGKIFFHQRKNEKKVKKVALGTMKPPRRLAWSTDEEETQNSNLPKSMVDLLTQILCLALLTFDSVILITMNSIIDPASLNIYRYRWIVYWNQIISLAIGVIGIPGVYYIRNTSLPKAIWRNVKNAFNFDTNVRSLQQN